MALAGRSVVLLVLLTFSAVIARAFFHQAPSGGTPFSWRSVLRSTIDVIPYARDVLPENIVEVAKEEGIKPTSRDPFSLSTASILAGFAFESYNDPSPDVKWDLSKDGSQIAYLSEDFVEDAFAGVLMATVLRVEGRPKKLTVSLALDEPDRHTSLYITERRNRRDRWGDSFLLYVKDPAVAMLNITAEGGGNFIIKDHFLGATNITLDTVLGLNENEPDSAPEEGWSGWVQINPKLKVQLDLKFVPFSKAKEEAEHLIEEKMPSVPAARLGCDVPKEDWAMLTSEATKKDDAALDPCRFERIAFVEHLDSETQCTIWRDTGRKQLLISFRGTSHWRDVLTDATLVQEPLDLLLPGDGGLEKFEKHLLRSRQEWLATTLTQVRESLPDQVKDLTILLPGVAEALEAARITLGELQGSDDGNSTGNSTDTSAAHELKEIREAKNATEAAGELEKWVNAMIDGAKQLVDANADEDKGGGLARRVGELTGAFGKGQKVAAEVLKFTSSYLAEQAEMLKNTNVSVDFSFNSEPDKGMHIGIGVKINGSEMTALASSPDEMVNTLKEKVPAIGGAIDTWENVSSSLSSVSLPELIPELPALPEKIIPALPEIPEIPSIKNATDGIVKFVEEKKMSRLTKAETALKEITSLGRLEPLPMVHSGFLRAYKNIQATLSDVVFSATAGKPHDWEIFLTGHSLGGALATLAAADLARGGAGDWNPEQAPKITMYNYGSPRVGNEAFVELYSELVGGGYRLVNNADIIASLPTASWGAPVVQYDHIGKTVVIEYGGEGAVWIEGECEGECPVRAREGLGNDTIDGFFEKERKFLATAFNKEAIMHHLEPSYFSALCNGLGIKWPPQSEEEEKANFFESAMDSAKRSAGF